MKIKHYTIPVFVPEKACPFQCIFCDQRKISGKIKIPSFEETKQIIENYLTTLSGKNAIIEIGFFGGNFTGIPLEEQEEYLKIASSYLNEEKINGIRLSTRPDYINVNVIRLLQKYNVTTVELGAQTFDEEVLKKSGRGHTASDIVKASKMIKEAGIELGLQMMIGLPGDSFEKSIYTANRIIELDAKNTRIYPTLVIKGTKLESLFRKGKYKPLSLDEAIKWTKEILLMFEKNNVEVIRTGLHPSEGLLSGEEIISGPFHISFKELVLTKIWEDLINDKISNNRNKNIVIDVHPKEINYAIGYNSANKKMLEQKFRKVKFTANPSINKRKLDVVYS